MVHLVSSIIYAEEGDPTLCIVRVPTVFLSLRLLCNDWIVDQLGIRLLLLRKFSVVHREENEGRQKNKAGMRD